MKTNNYLDLLNERLVDLDKDIIVEGNKFFNIFIIGAPRSGTTLINQLFAGCTDIGYVSNLMAAFWNAPVAGALLSRRWANDRYFSGNSYFGQTKDIREPHEFGAFWRDMLSMDSMHQPSDSSIKFIDWNELELTLTKINMVFSKPVIYKAFHLMWFIKEINKKMPNSKWIWIKRNTIDNAGSILNLRRHLNSNIYQWASAKPLGIENYLNRDPYIEVIAQVELINYWIDSQLKDVSPRNWTTVSLESLIENTGQQFAEITRWGEVELDQFSMKKSNQIIKNKNKNKIRDFDLKKLNQAYEKFHE